MVMLEFSRYRLDIHNAISKLDRNGQCKFAAWCCNVVLKDEEVRSFLAQRPGGRIFLGKLEGVLDDIRQDLCADRARVENLVEVTGPFLPEGVLGDVLAQEVPEQSHVLSSLEVIDAFLGWGLSGSASYLEECAVARLDRVGLLIEFDSLDAGALEKEASSQLQVLSDLSERQRSTLSVLG
jgi:hypothetical protein